jgi:hypothetical protein
VRGRFLDLTCDVETTVTAETDVDQHDIGPEFDGALQRLVSVGGRTHDVDAIALQHVAHGHKEREIVVSYQAARIHTSRVAPVPPNAHGG